jgi:hypothetical protein
MAQHMAEPGPGVKGWDVSLVIDCTPAQHDDLQELIKGSLSGDWKSPRPEFGQGIFLEGLPAWDFGVYQSERAKKSIEVRTQHHIFSPPLAWAQDAAGACAGGAGAAVRSPGLYTGGPMAHHDENDRLAIRAITQQQMPKRLSVAEIAKLAGLADACSCKKFKRKFSMYKDEVGHGWKCTEATAAAKRKKYELA